MLRRGHHHHVSRQRRVHGGPAHGVRRRVWCVPRLGWVGLGGGAGEGAHTRRAISLESGSPAPTPSFNCAACPPPSILRCLLAPFTHPRCRVQLRGAPYSTACAPAWRGRSCTRRRTARCSPSSPRAGCSCESLRVGAAARVPRRCRERVAPPLLPRRAWPCRGLGACLVRLRLPALSPPALCPARTLSVLQRRC